MKVRISLHDAAKYAAAGLDVECYVNIKQLGEKREPQLEMKVPVENGKPLAGFRRKRLTLRTSETTKYRIGVKSPNLGTYSKVVYDAAAELTNKDPTKVFTRKALTDSMKLAGKEELDKVVAHVSQLRDRGYLILVEV